MKTSKLLTLALLLTSLCTFTASAALVSESSGTIDSSTTFGGEAKPATPPAVTTPTITSPSGVYGSSDSAKQPSDIHTTENPNTATEGTAPSAPAIADISENDWFYNDVMYVYENKIMSGVGNNLFSPNAGITRAMMITIIYRTAGEPDAAASSFTDVEQGSWYANAVAWGAENKIVNGTGNNKFSPDDYITREQLAVMLYNYSKLTGKSGNSVDVSAYADATAVSSWAKDAMSWAVGNKIVNGKSESTLAPADGATRAEAAAIIRRFISLAE